MFLGGNATKQTAMGENSIVGLFFGNTVQRYPQSKPRMTVRVVTTAGFLLHLSSGATWPLVDPKMVSL